MKSDALVVAVAVGAAACAMVLGLAAISWMAGRGRSAAGDPPPVGRPLALPRSVADGLSRKQLPVLAEELSTHAESAAARAVRAQSAVAAARAALTAAETERARTEAAYDAARAAHDDLLRTVTVRPDPDRDARERATSRAALAAYRRGELSVEVLRSVFAQPDPGPERDWQEHEADRLALAESQARRAFQRAVAAAWMAREELHVVEVAEIAVRQEAADAAQEAQEAALAVRAKGSRRRR